MSDLEEALQRARGGGPERHREKSRDQGKLPVRDRVARLIDSDSFVEDALLANWEQDGFGADGHGIPRRLSARLLPVRP